MTDLLDDIDLTPKLMFQGFQWDGPGRLRIFLVDEAGVMQAATLVAPAPVMEAMPASANGHRVVHRAGQYPHICAGCGDEFTSNRRPVPGKRSWCGKPECKKQAAALRADEYRKRKSKETT